MENKTTEGFRPKPKTQSTIVLRYWLYNPAYGDKGNPRTLTVLVRADNSIMYTHYQGWGNSGGVAYSMGGLPGLPKNLGNIKTLDDLDATIQLALKKGRGSNYVKEVEYVNNFPKNTKITKPKMKKPEFKNYLREEIKSTLKEESPFNNSLIKWERKPNELGDIETTFYDKLPKEIQNKIKSLPIYNNIDLFDDFTSPKIEQYFITNNKEGIFLINTEGYNYARYATKLANTDSFLDEAIIKTSPYSNKQVNFRDIDLGGGDINHTFDTIDIIPIKNDYKVKIITTYYYRDPGMKGYEYSPKEKPTISDVQTFLLDSKGKAIKKKNFTGTNEWMLIQLGKKFFIPQFVAWWEDKILKLNLNNEATIETSPENLDKVKQKSDDDDVIKVTEFMYEPTVKIGQTVKIPSNLTTDPKNKQGEEGRVIFIDQEGNVYVLFKDKVVGGYDMNVFDKGINEEDDLNDNDSNIVDEIIKLLSKIIEIVDKNGYEANNFDLEGFTQTLEDFINELSEIGDLNEGFNSLNEMAKLQGDLRDSIQKVINSNPELEGYDLKLKIRKNPEVIKSLGNQTLNNTQLVNFISLVRGERSVGKRGPKVDPNKPKPSKKKPTPKDSKVIKPTTSTLGGKKYYTSKTNDSEEEGPSDRELRKLAKSGGGKMEKQKISDLQQQERTKLIKNFLNDMKKVGVVDNSNKILDRKKYDTEWEKVKKDINVKVKKVK